MSNGKLCQVNLPWKTRNCQFQCKFHEMVSNFQIQRSQKLCYFFVFLTLLLSAYLTELRSENRCSSKTSWGAKHDNVNVQQLHTGRFQQYRGGYIRWVLVFWSFTIFISESFHHWNATTIRSIESLAISCSFCLRFFEDPDSKRALTDTGSIWPDCTSFAQKLETMLKINLIAFQRCKLWHRHNLFIFAIQITQHTLLFRNDFKETKVFDERT